MKLQELKLAVDNAIEKYGDRDVTVDVEARKFDYHLAEVKYANMMLSDDDYTESPELLDDESLNMFVISLTN